MRQTTWLVIVAASGTLATAACRPTRGAAQGPTYPMAGGPSAPSATGSISTSTDMNGNTALMIEVKHLAPPARVVPNGTTYVAWIVPFQPQMEGQPTEGQGASPSQQAQPQQAPQPQPPTYQQPYQQQQPMQPQPYQQPYQQQQPMQPQPYQQPYQQQQQQQPMQPQQPPMQPQQPMYQQPQQPTGYSQSYPGCPAPTGTAPMQQNFITAPSENMPGMELQQILPPGSGEPINAGAIQLDAKLEGRLRTTTPYTQFMVIITPEADPTVTAPTNPPVLIARVQR